MLGKNPTNNYVMSNGQPKNMYILNFVEIVQAVFFLLFYILCPVYFAGTLNSHSNKTWAQLQNYCN